MLYLGIDQHARQITISLRDDSGDVLQARQVSTQPEKIQAFFAKLTRECVRDGESFIAVVEVCGFNDWLIRLLRDFRCHRVILIQPEERKKRKTDRRDAAALSELLWVNRARFLAGKPVRGLRQVDIAAPTDQENRRLPIGRASHVNVGGDSRRNVLGANRVVSGDIADELGGLARHLDGVFEQATKFVTTLRGADSNTDDKVVPLVVTVDECLGEDHQFRLLVGSICREIGKFLERFGCVEQYRSRLYDSDTP